MKSVCVVYAETRAGKTALSMAVDAARLFGGAVPLKVIVPSEVAAPESISEQKARVHAVVAGIAGEQAFEIEIVEGSEPFVSDEKALLIAHRAKDCVGPSFYANRNDTLLPVSETALEARRSGPILIPFSDGETGLVAARTGIQLALAWREQRVLAEQEPELIFYHTTWPDDGGISPDAEDQICEEAIRVMLAIEQAARDAGVRYRTIVETHDDVVQGVIEMAQDTGSVLILMARGSHIRQGSYVERTVEQSPVPVYVAGSASGRVSALVDERDAVEQFRAYRRELVAARAARPKVAWYRRLHELPVLRDPLFVTGVVAVMWLLKAIAKITVGLWINSPMVAGDGFHNIADVLEVVAVGVVLFIAARQATRRYPYGRKNMEWFTQLGIGVMLFAAAGKFIVDCGVGLLSYAPGWDHAVRSVLTFLPEHEAVAIDGHTFPWVLAVTGVSFLLSQVLSRYQIIVGKRTGHASLIANGEEAASDGWIEAVTVFGVIAEFVTGWGFLEYILGLVVAAMIMRTARELFVTGWRVLLQHSIGEEHEESLREACLRVSNVKAVAELKTFQVGHTAVVMVTCETLAESHGATYVKRAVENAIEAYLLAGGEDAQFKAADIHVKMQRPDPRRHRVGYALFIHWTNEAELAASLAAASHIAVCDVEHDDIVRTKVLALEGLDDTGRSDLIAEKRIQQVFTTANTTAYALPVHGLVV